MLLCMNLYFVVLFYLLFDHCNAKNSRSNLMGTSGYISAVKNAHFDENKFVNLLQKREWQTKVIAEKPTNEESSTMDEKSLSSVIEDKKTFEKFEREAEVYF